MAIPYARPLLAVFQWNPHPRSFMVLFRPSFRSILIAVSGAVVTNASDDNDKNGGDHAEVDALLKQWRDGNDEALDALLPILYADLRRLAASYLRKEVANHTLQPTALVSEAYLKISGRRHVPVESRAHFMATAAEAMRRILVDHARRKASNKRGGDRRRVTLHDSAGSDDVDVDVLALDQALDRLEALDQRMAAVVKLRYFAGLGVDETAAVLDTSPRSINRDWTAARAWLRRELGAAAVGEAD